VRVFITAPRWAPKSFLIRSQFYDIWIFSAWRCGYSPNVSGFCWKSSRLPIMLARSTKYRYVVHHQDRRLRCSVSFITRAQSAPHDNIALFSISAESHPIALFGYVISYIGSGDFPLTVHSLLSVLKKKPPNETGFTITAHNAKCMYHPR
jgi:hypothetical protein